MWSPSLGVILRLTIWSLPFFFLRSCLIIEESPVALEHGANKLKNLGCVPNVILKVHRWRLSVESLTSSLVTGFPRLFCTTSFEKKSFFKQIPVILGEYSRVKGPCVSVLRATPDFWGRAWPGLPFPLLLMSPNVARGLCLLKLFLHPREWKLGSFFLSEVGRLPSDLPEDFGGWQGLHHPLRISYFFFFLYKTFYTCYLSNLLPNRCFLGDSSHIFYGFINHYGPTSATNYGSRLQSSSTSGLTNTPDGISLKSVGLMSRVHLEKSP